MPGLDAGLADDDSADRLGLGAKPVAHVVLAAERLHHLDADHGFVGGLGQVTLALLHLPRDRHHAVGEVPREDPDQRRRDDGVERQTQIHVAQEQAAAHDHHRALDGLHHAPADEVAHGVQVVGCARDDLPGRVSVVERAGKLEVGLIQQLAHAGLEPHAHP